MVCGTGKTYTSLKIIKSLEPKPNIVFFLAPSIALVSQTFREYCAQRVNLLLLPLCVVIINRDRVEMILASLNLLLLPQLSQRTFLQLIREPKREEAFLLFSPLIKVPCVSKMPKPRIG